MRLFQRLAIDKKQRTIKSAPVTAQSISATLNTVRNRRKKYQARHRAPHDRFWDSLSQKSIRHAANH
jgi:hypothetical protein